VIKLKKFVSNKRSPIPKVAMTLIGTAMMLALLASFFTGFGESQQLAWWQMEFCFTFGRYK
jgi:hypothetical protein